MEIGKGAKKWELLRGKGCSIDFLGVYDHDGDDDENGGTRRASGVTGQSCAHRSPQLYVEH